MSSFWTTNRAAAKAAVLAAGLSASMALGAGVAAAADSPAGSDIFATGTAGQLANATGQQADRQDAAVKAAKAEKDRKEKASRDAARKANSWVKPVTDKYELSASFGNSGGRWAHKHSGQDFAVPTGTKVDAVHKGTVVKAGGNGAGDGPAYGNAIVIKHSKGSFSQYAHLSKINVKPGQTVKAGQKIGLSGDTGNSSGPHLHFEIRHNANYGSAIEPKAAMHRGGVDF